MNIFRRIVGGESSSKKGALVVHNLDDAQVAKIRAEWKKKGKPQSLKEVYPLLGPLADPLTSYLLSNHKQLSVDDVIMLTDRLLFDLSEAADVLSRIYPSIEDILSALAGAVAYRRKWSPVELDRLLQYLRVEMPQNSSRLESFLVSHPVLPMLIKYVFSPLIFEEGANIFPKRELAHSDLLDEASILVINAHLPMRRRANWYSLFSTSSHGASFSQLIQRINNEGPCLLIAEAEGNQVFGCFASDGFVIGPRYRGDETSFLFSAKPQLRISYPTGFCKEFAYMNHQQQQLPNGIGIGGFEDTWPLFLSDDFGHGMALKGMRAFEKIELCDQKKFKVTAVQAWRVGEKPKDPNAEDLDGNAQKSILDKDPQAMAVLELAGRKMHSEAYREPPRED